MCGLIEDIMNSSFTSTNEEIQQEVHALQCKTNLRDLANNYYPYWNTNDKAKRIEVFQLPKFKKFLSDHKYSITLPERRGIFEIKVSNECDFTVSFKKNAE